ncbi:hypothetical protein [Alicyclobacillus fodiniaquatilis]|uniref:Uncharacterized protein n=1 Tax=Alicyclobacillus fodiniaquatilis TaxID=1661150 RepID=A0ABW4JCA5_9BACL
MANTTEMMSIEAVQQVVERILANAFACVVHATVTRITDEERRNQVYRCEIQGDHPDLPSSVIVKQALHGNGIFNDWAGVQFLSQLGVSISPRYFGGDRQTGLLLIEDIKDAKGIHDVLLDGTAVESKSHFVLVCPGAWSNARAHNRAGAGISRNSRRVGIGPFRQ